MKIYILSLFFFASFALPSSLVSDLVDGPHEQQVRVRSRAADASSLFKISSPKISSRIDISGYLKRNTHQAEADLALHVDDKFVASTGDGQLKPGIRAGDPLARLSKYRAYLDALRDEKLATANFKDFESISNDYIKSELKRWRKFTDDSKNMDELEKVTRANNWFNANINYVSDPPTDPWKPMITFFMQGGDCEDFAFAKMETLKEMGVPEERLQAAYVRVPNVGAHMVLLYDTPDRATTYVLDNYDRRLRTTAFDRENQKYSFVFSFNGKDLLVYGQ